MIKQFPCPRCIKVFTQKKSLNCHIQRKIPCTKVYNCLVCKKEFFDSFNLDRHYESQIHILQCRIVDDVPPNNRTNQPISRESGSNGNGTANVTGDSNTILSGNDNNNTIINNNISINFTVYGGEDYGIVNVSRLVKVIQRHPDKVEIILHIIEMVNFNPKHPENSNIYVSNKKTKDINLYGKNGWEIRTQNYSKDLILDTLKFLRNIYEDYSEQLDKNQKAKFLDLLHFTRVPSDDLLTDKKFKTFQSDVLCYLYNNRDIVLNLLSK